MMFTLQDAIDLATFAHRHQYDKAGEPYIQHPLRVLESTKAQGAQAYVQCAAVLHDVTEDTPFTCDMLLALGVPESAVDIVALVDRNHSKNKWGDVADTVDGFTNYPREVTGYDSFYYYNIRNNPGALIVKKADIGDNLQPWRLAYLSETKQAHLRQKYAKALEMLN